MPSPRPPVALTELPGLTRAPAEFPRSRVYDAVMDAQALVAEFAARHGWQAHAARRVFDEVRVFASQEELWETVLALHDLAPETPMITAGLAAACEKMVLMAVTPEVYAQVQPAYAAADPDSWTRLLAHELVHRLHVEVLEGEEERMGPTWFFEGFAVVGAGQSLVPPPAPRAPAELLGWASSARGPGAYARFGHAVRVFARREGLRELVARAGDEDFEAWLLRR